MRVLCFDYGEKRIGVAAGNTMISSANPVTVLTAKHGIPNWQQISNLIQQWQPQKLIVGLPTQFDGTDITATKPSQKFARRLVEQTKLPVELFDERLSSHEARNLNAEMKQDRVDDLAAQVILQSWLNHQLDKTN